jgi:hypothetical protein
MKSRLVDAKTIGGGQVFLRVGGEGSGYFELME